MYRPDEGDNFEYSMISVTTDTLQSITGTSERMQKLAMSEKWREEVLELESCRYARCASGSAVSEVFA
jgi:hypothetical protein